MASFTEQATLSVKDNSTGPLKKINAELKKLFATAKSLKSTKVDLKVTAPGLSKATADVKALTAATNKLKTSAVNLKVNTSGIAQASRQIANLHSQARHPITLRTVAGAVAGSAAAHAVGRAAKEGTRTLDVGETSLALKEIPEGARRNFVDEQIRKIGAEQAKRVGGATFNRGHIQQQMSEMLGVVKIGAARDEQDFQKRAQAAAYMADQNLELAATFVKLGMDTAKAQETSAKFGKAMEQQGKIFDTEGKLNVEAAAQEYNNIRKLIPTIGKEATGENYLAMMKYLRVSKFSLEPEAIASAMFKFEEMGTGAAVGINQLIKNLQGSAKPSALAEQARLGLIPIEWGKDKKGKPVPFFGDMDPAKSKKLRESPQTYVNEEFVPALIKDLMKGTKKRKALTREEAEKKTFEPAYIAAQTQKVASDRTAQEMLASMVLLRKENEEALRDYRSRTGSMESQRKATKLSIIGATAAIESQAQGLFGEMARAIAPVLVPTLGVMSEAMRNIGDTIATAQGTGPEAEAAQEKVKAGMLATVAAAPFAKMGLDIGKGFAKPVLDAIDIVAKPIGMISAIEGMTSQRPEVRSLSAAGWLLQQAAADLSAAAGKQSSWWDTIRDAAAGKTAWDAVKQGVKYLGAGAMTAARVGGPLAGPTAATGIAYALNQIIAAARDNPEAWAQSAIANAKLDLAAAKRAESTELDPARKTEFGNQIARLNATISKLEGDLKYMQGETKPAWLDPKTLAPPPPEAPPAWGDPKTIAAQVAAQLKKSWTFEPLMKPPEPPPGLLPPGWKPFAGTPPAEAAQPLTDAAGKLDSAAGNLLRATEFSGRKKTPGEGTPGEDEEEPPRRYPLFRPKRETATDAAVKPVGDVTSLATTIATLPTNMLTVTSSFASVFGTGATNMSTALITGGQSAASTIANAMPGAGAALGNAAAAAIRAAVASISVNVNVNGGEKKADTGAMNGPT